MILSRPAGITHPNPRTLTPMLQARRQKPMTRPRPTPLLCRLGFHQLGAPWMHERDEDVEHRTCVRCGAVKEYLL